MRDIQEKENAASGSNDLLSAFVDKPVVEEVSPEEPAAKEPEKSPEDETWEEKEKTIEKEVITNADVEEREIIPKMPQTTILQTCESFCIHIHIKILCALSQMKISLSL